MRFKIDWASLVVGRKFTGLALFFFVFEGNFQVQAGCLYLEGLIFGILRYVQGVAFVNRTLKKENCYTRKLTKHSELLVKIELTTL